MNFFHLKNNVFVWPVFLLLTTYAVLRAFFVEPLFDELGTFYWYIQTGLLPGHGAAMDANNHILNSIIGNLLYESFGDHFVLYRLLAFIAFPIYFFSARYFLLQSNNQFSVFTFLALVSVHWIFDYFTLSRGYGPSLGFFMLLLCFISQWTKSFKTRYVIGAILCFILILLSNLSMLIPVLLLFSYMVLCMIVYFKIFKLKDRILFLALSLCFMLFMVPVIIYLNQLKKAGALWWGSTDGLWEVTGKSLVQNTLFTDHIIWKWIVLVMVLISLVLLIIQRNKTGSKAFLLTQYFFIPVLLGLCLLSSVILAMVFKVNYPMDRVGMYLVPLFMLSIGFLFQEQRYLKWMLISLVWFPISFIAKINLNTTVFSPCDRIHQEFFNKMNALVSPDDVLSTDYVSHASYAYLSRSEKQTHILLETPDDTLTFGDFHLSWFGDFNESGYRLVLRDSITNTSLYKRIAPVKREKIIDTIISMRQSKELYIPLLELPITKEIQENGLIQTTVSGSVELDRGMLGLNLCHQLINNHDESVLYKPTRFDWYFGHKTKYCFSFPNQPYRIDSTHQKLEVFMANNDYVNVKLKNVRIRVYLSDE